MSLQSFLADGGELQTVSVRKCWQSSLLEHIKPEYVDVVSVRTSSLPRLMQTHQDRVTPAEPQSLSLSEFKQRLPQQLERFFQHAIKQGCLRELRPREIRRLISEKNEQI